MKRRRKKELRTKLISILVAIALILVVGIVAFGAKIKKAIDEGEEINGRWFLSLIYPDKYAYSTEIADYNDYYQLMADDDVAIILQDEILEDKAKLINGQPYFSYDTVSKIFTNRFYHNSDEKVLLYTTSTDIIKVDMAEGTSGYYVSGAFTETPAVCATYIGDTLYISADFVKNYANFSYAYYSQPNRVQVYTKFGTERAAKVKKKTKVRVKGGIKSDILASLEKDQQVTVLEVMEKWTRIKTEDGFIGYVEKNKLSDEFEYTRPAVTDAYNPYDDYSMGTEGESLVVAWHQIFYADNGSNLNTLTVSSNGIDVVSPTWYYLNSENGTFTDYSSTAYVTNAHEKGYKVWALVEDMTNSDSFSEYNLFSSSANRKALIDNLISSVKAAGADGINIDFEKIGKETGPHYVQFLRELSIEAHKNGLVLSVDDYQQNEGNLYYNLKEQGLVADYVIIMGYDEHWAGCQEAGSVASLDFVENGITKALDAGVPAAKLINGVPFYTRLWKTEGVNVSSSALDMTTAANWYQSHNIIPSWDETTSQFYASRTDGTATYEMWVENADSISAKLAVMKNHNLAGVACWKLGFETPDIWDVIVSYY